MHAPPVGNAMLRCSGTLPAMSSQQVSMQPGGSSERGAELAKDATKPRRSIKLQQISDS